MSLTDESETDFAGEKELEDFFARQTYEEIELANEINEIAAKLREHAEFAGDQLQNRDSFPETSGRVLKPRQEEFTALLELAQKTLSSVAMKEMASAEKMENLLAREPARN